MQVDALAIRLRQRSNGEAADLGVRLCQHAARSVFTCYLAVALPIMLVCLALIEVAAWLPTVAIWLAKPWLDRTILYVLSRAAFGQATTPRDVIRARREIWWSQLLRSWTQRRLSPWRSLTGPVYQLEGLRGARQRKRVRQIRAGKSGAGLMVTSAFGLAELAITMSFVSLFVWFAPQGMAPELWELLLDSENQTSIQFVFALAYAITVAFVEPYYVAAGFGLYLNRRVELEAWDIEQELKRARAR
jgi:hypothetical protein